MTTDRTCLLHSLLETIGEKAHTALATVFDCFMVELKELGKHFMSGLDLECERVRQDVEICMTNLNAERRKMSYHKTQVIDIDYLDVGGHRYTTSTTTFRSIPNTFIDAYFSGRYNRRRNRMEQYTSIETEKCSGTC